MKLNNTRKICALTAAVLLIQGTHISAAGNLDMHKHISNLKYGLLMLGGDYYNYVFDYDINSDDKTNVLDLCRMKRSILNNDSQEILDSLAIEKLNVVLGECIKSQNNDRVFTIPVMLEKNYKGISALQFDFSYNERYFTLQDVYTGDVSGDVSVSSNKKTVQFIESNGYNVEGDKVVLYAEFSYDAGIPDGIYDFGLYNISASNLTKKGQRMLVDEEIEEYSYGYMFHTSEFSVPVTSATTVTTTTPVPQTTTTTTLPTTITTTTTTLPTTITTTTTTLPTTITTTTTPLPTTTTVITTTDPPPQTTVPKYEDGSVYFQVGQPQENHSEMVIRVPVYIQNNTIGVSSVNAVLNYRSDLFNIKRVLEGDFSGQFSISQNTGEISYASDNEIKSNGIVFYVELEPKTSISAQLLEFSLSSIEAVTIIDDGRAWEIPEDKCQKSSSVTYFWTNGLQAPAVTYPTTTEPPVTTTITTATEPPVTTTVTTATEPPVTTTVTTATEPPVTTTVTTATEPPVTTTVTTTTTPPVTTITTTTTTQVTTTVPDVPEEKLQFLNKVNEYRSANNMAPMTADARACVAADKRAEMLSVSYSEKLTNGKNFKHIMYEYGVFPFCVSQYINNSCTTWDAMYSNYISQVRSALLSKDFDKLGIGHYVNESGRHFWAVFTYG